MFEVLKGELIQRHCRWGEVTWPRKEREVSQSAGGKKRIPSPGQALPSHLCRCRFVSTMEALVKCSHLRGLRYFFIFELQVLHLVARS